MGACAVALHRLFMIIYLVVRVCVILFRQPGLQGQTCGVGLRKYYEKMNAPGLAAGRWLWKASATDKDLTLVMSIPKACTDIAASVGPQSGHA